MFSTEDQLYDEGLGHLTELLYSGYGVNVNEIMRVICELRIENPRASDTDFENTRVRLREAFGFTNSHEDW